MEKKIGRDILEEMCRNVEEYQGKGCSYIVGETWCMLCENWSGGYKGGSQEESALLPAQSAPDPLT